MEDESGRSYLRPHGGVMVIDCSVFRTVVAFAAMMSLQCCRWLVCNSTRTTREEGRAEDLRENTDNYATII